MCEEKKVLIVANDFTTIHHFRMELLDRLLQDGYAVTIALPEDARNAQFCALGCRVEPIPMSRFGTNPVADMRTMFAIKKIIHKLQPAAVLTYTAKANIYGGMASALEKVPYICTITGLGVNFAKENLISKIMLLLQRVALRKAQKVFFQNESNRSFFQKHHIACHNGQVISGSGVNLQQNSFEPYPANPVTKFIAAARIRQDKGYDELFAAIEKCAQAGIAAEFHIVGWYEDESYKQIVQKMQDEYGVVFYDYVPHEQMHALMAQCDCLLQPSHHEGMSNVILEAAATGRPCIVSNISGCKEGVVDGSTGFWFQVKDSDDLYKKIVQFTSLSAQERAQMGENARRHMEENFDRAYVVQQYIQQIRQAQKT